MTKQLHYRAQFFALIEQERGERVTEIVQVQPSEVGALRSCSKRRLTLRGSIGVPIVLANTRPWSSHSSPTTNRSLAWRTRCCSNARTARPDSGTGRAERCVFGGVKAKPDHRRPRPGPLHGVWVDGGRDGRDLAGISYPPYVLPFLYSAAAALEIFGLIVTIIDIGKAQRRLDGYFSRSINVYVTDVTGIVDAFDATVVTEQAEPLTFEQRLNALEQWRHDAPPSSREPGSYEEMPSPGHTRSQHSDARRAGDLGTHAIAPSEAPRPGTRGRPGIPLISR